MKPRDERSDRGGQNMIVWGHGRKLQTLGPVGRQECPQCGQVATIWLSVIRKQFTLYWIPVARWTGDYYLMCGICNASAPIDKALGARLRAELDGHTAPAADAGEPAQAAQPVHAFDTFYDLLGVAPDATVEEIRRCYRIRAQLVHPDHHAGAADEVVEEARRQMGLLNEAWDVLRDPERRAAYDAKLARPSAPPRTNPAPPRDPAPVSKHPKLGTQMTRTAWVMVASIALILVVAVIAGIASSGDQHANASAPPPATLAPVVTAAPDTTVFVPETDPFPPAGYYSPPANPDIGYKFLTGSAIHCDAYTSCWNIVAITQVDCPFGISVEMQVEDANGNVVDSATDSIDAEVDAGQTALLKPTYLGSSDARVTAANPVFTCTP